MKTILCYGDSNTWGFIPGSVTADSFYIGDIQETFVLQGNYKKYLNSLAFCNFIQIIVD